MIVIQKSKEKLIKLILKSSTLFLIIVLGSCLIQKNRSHNVAIQENEFINIRANEISLGTIEKHVQLSGEVFATNVVRISPDTAGLLTKVLVEPGDSVYSDQIIAWVDPTRPGMSYAESPVMSKTSGTVTHVPVIAGNQVSPQMVIAEVGDLKNLEIVSKVPERFLATLRMGLIARISTRAYPDAILPARINKISPVVDPRSRTVYITLKPNTNDKIRPGQSVTVDLVLETHNNVVLIPESAITERYTSEGVFVISDGKALWQEASFGISQSGMIEVLDGLKAGDQIAIAGINDLTDGISVQVLDN